MRKANESSQRVTIIIPNDLAAEISAIKDAETARGVKTTDNKVTVQLMRWGLITARELGRMPNPAAYE
jgi:hypothetical protein